MKCRNVTACLKNLCVSVMSVLQFSSTDVLCFKLEARGLNVAPHVMLCGPTERSFVSEDDLSEDELLLKKILFNVFFLFALQLPLFLEGS